MADEPNTGLLIVGGWCDAVTTELWGPDGTQCMLPDLSSRSQTLNVLQDRVLACYSKSCDQLTASGWDKAHDLLFERNFYTTIVTSDGMLLIGGASVNGGNETEEMVPINNGPNEPAFSLEWWKFTDRSICSIKVSDTSLVLTGGDRSHSKMMVTQLSKLGTWKNVAFKGLPQLNSGRSKHACGSYWVNEVQMLIVAGGYTTHGDPLSSTEVINFMDQSGGWRESSRLPSPRFALAGTTLSGVFHVTGGSRIVNQYCDDNHEILSWDSVAETWNLVGHTILPRDSHAVTEVNLDDIKTFCSHETTSTSAPTSEPSTTPSSTPSNTFSIR